MEPLYTPGTNRINSLAQIMALAEICMCRKETASRQAVSNTETTDQWLRVLSLIPAHGTEDRAFLCPCLRYTVVHLAPGNYTAPGGADIPDHGLRPILIHPLPAALTVSRQPNLNRDAATTDIIGGVISAWDSSLPLVNDADLLRVTVYCVIAIAWTTATKGRLGRDRV